MSFKSVEMQIAIPRTNDAGNWQHQMTNKPVYDQAALAAKTVQQAERQRKQSTKVDEPSSPGIRDEERKGGANRGGGKGEGRKRNVPDKAKTAPEPSGHPYKGRHIDLTL